MNKRPFRISRILRVRLLPTLAFLLAVTWKPLARGDDYIDWNRWAFQPTNLNLLIATDEPLDTSPRPSRVRLFGIPSAFPADPVGIEQADFNPANPGFPTRSPVTDDSDSTPSWITIAIGNDNPYFELRRPGDPGGVGYYRLASQVQLFDSSTTACAIGLQAFTPAGMQVAGVGTGPTSVCPNVAVYQQLLEGLALHSFVGQNLNIDQHVIGQFRQRIQCGVGLHQALLPEVPDRTENMYLFVQAMGRYHYDAVGGTNLTASAAGQTTGMPPMLMEVLPGLQWKASDNLWWSSGYSVPVGPVRPGDGGRLQFTCSFQF